MAKLCLQAVFWKPRQLRRPRQLRQPRWRCLPCSSGQIHNSPPPGVNGIKPFFFVTDLEAK
jgi:hypothetical protein